MDNKKLWLVVGVLLVIIAGAFMYGRYSNKSELEAIGAGKTGVPEQTVQAVKEAAEDADDASSAADKAAESARKAADSTRATAISAQDSAKDASDSAKDSAANVNVGEAGNNREAKKD